jgi:hypothetical protein
MRFAFNFAEPQKAMFHYHSMRWRPIKMQPNTITKILVFGFFTIFLLSLGACQIKSAGVHIGDEPSPVVVAKAKRKGGPPPHAPAHGYRAKHHYRYYPSCYVYFDISRKCYFYLSGDSWKVSASLPSHMRVQLGEYVSIEMDTDKPYTKFKDHKKKSPPGQLKKKKKEEKWS